MCKHQLPKIKATTLPVRDKQLTQGKTEAKGVDFVSCGLDRVCPSSVTTHQGQGVRLDQYQSSIGEKSNRRRRQNKIEGSVLDTTSTQPSLLTLNAFTGTADHEFEWYDLDAIRELESGDKATCAIVIGHDFKAGLLFTTERQLLNREVEANVPNTSVSNENNKMGQEFEFDLFFWVNSDNSKAAETSDDREFRERMEELESEVKSDLSLSPPPLLQLSPSFSSCSSLSNSDEASDQKDSDDNGNFFTSWL